MINLYWPAYQRLEKEFLDLAYCIHVDDKQMTVYSPQIGDLLIRAAVEVEAISKELYFSNGGSKPDDNELFYDTDCLQLLEEKWSLSKKELLVSSCHLFLEQPENKILQPLHKAFKRGSSSSMWQRAYQAVKHNRAKSLDKGNIKNLLSALGALFILNVYYRDGSVLLGASASVDNVDASCGSKLFHVSVHASEGVLTDGTMKKTELFEKSILLILPQKDGYEKIITQLKKMQNDSIGQAIEEINSKGLAQANMSKEDIVKLITDKRIECIRTDSVGLKQLLPLFQTLQYECVVNKNQI